MNKTLLTFLCVCLFFFLNCSGTNRPLGISFSKIRKQTQPPVCSGVINARKLQIQCSADSGSNGNCKAISSGAPLYFILVPNNSNDAFLDGNAGLLSNCSDLWNSIAGITPPPTDVIGAFISGVSASDSVNCSDGGGCTASPTECLSGWDPTLFTPSALAASITSGNYLACAFIDTPSLGPPPQLGLASISNATTFAKITVSGTILLNSWVDY